MRLTTVERWAVVVILLLALAASLSLSFDSGKEPPVTVVKVFEDGSFVMSDGTTGCTPGALCDDN